MLPFVIVPLFVVRMVSASAGCDSSLPSNLQAGMLQAQIVELVQRSETFRQQCRRIGRSRVLRVTVQLTTTIEAGARAQTVIHRYQAGSLRAEVLVLFAEDYVELLAHEFEHILEQVDGIVLGDEVGSGRAWQTASGAYETRRAFDAGVRARHEIDALAAAASTAAGDARKAAIAAGTPPRNQRP